MVNPLCINMPIKTELVETLYNVCNVLERHVFTVAYDLVELSSGKVNYVLRDFPSTDKLYPEGAPIFRYYLRTVYGLDIAQIDCILKFNDCSTPLPTDIVIVPTILVPELFED